jgi:putative membrane protein
MPTLSGSFWFLIGAGVLHALFTLCELFPWSLPVLLRIVTKRLPEKEAFTPAQQTLVATIVQNAGIYNAIVAGGLFWAAFGGASLTNVAHLLLAGAAVAGIFGTITLKSPITAVQALVGIIGFFLV